MLEARNLPAKVRSISYKSFFVGELSTGKTQAPLVRFRMVSCNTQCNRVIKPVMENTLIKIGSGEHHAGSRVEFITYVRSAQKGVSV